MDTRIERIIADHPGNLAVIVGNGINLYSNPTPANYTWKAMLNLLWIELSRNAFPIGDDFSFTEAYDIINLYSEGDVELQERVQSFVESIPMTDYHVEFCKSMKKHGLPVLTTNFDDLLEQSLYRLLKSPLNPLSLYKRIKGLSFSRYYPWDVYYSDSLLNTPLDGFSIWHINGMKKYPMSMRLGLRQYVNQISRVRRFIHNDEASLFNGKNYTNWKGCSTWLHTLFNHNILIMGLNMNVDEVFLRWLLIEREHYFTLFPERRREGWYLCLRDEMSDGKRFFLENLGFTVVEFDDYPSLYRSVLV